MIKQQEFMKKKIKESNIKGVDKRVSINPKKGFYPRKGEVRGKTKIEML